MSDIEEPQNEIIVDFNNNDTFDKIKNQVENDEPKPKRKSTKKIISEQAGPVEEDIKPKPKRKPKAKEPAEPVEVFEDIEDIKLKPKAKPKRKPKIIVEDLKPEPVPVEEQHQVKPDVYERKAPLLSEPVKKNIKTLEQVDCPKCEKPMTKTTLRYHHDKTCPGEKVNKSELPVKKRIVKEKAPDVIEPKPDKATTYKDRINEQIKIKKESIKKLASNIA